jgi:tetratricopeptide (TPR) repeat protein
MRVAYIVPILLIVVLGLMAAARSEQPATASSGDELTFARQLGWHMAMHVVEHLAASKQPGFPGIEAWLNDFGKQTKGLDPNDAPEKWPAVDIDALATHNPNFWRAYYEIEPGDPGAALLYAGLLLGGGETVRALNVIEFQQFGPGMPQGVRKTFGELLAATKMAGKKSNKLVEAGISLFDKKDYAGAIEKYREALKIWPQNAWAYYELAYTLRVQELIAAGERPELPGPGQMIVRTNSDVDVRVKFSPEVKAVYAQCRRYSPFMDTAYQGDDQDVIQGLLAVTGKIVPAMKSIGQGRDRATVDRAFQQLAEGCQEANVHDLALVARQILVARRGQYDRSDHPFITTSLRKLVPGPETEAILERLAGGATVFHRLIATEDPSPSQAPERMFRLGTPQFVKERDLEDTFTIVVPIEVQNPEHFEKPGLKLAYVLFDEAITAAPNDLKFVDGTSVVTTEKDGGRDLMLQVRSEQRGVTGQAHFVFVPPQYKAVGTTGVMRFGLRGLPDKDMGLFVVGTLKEMQPSSNVLVFRKTDFIIGNGDATFQAAVAKLPAGNQPDKDKKKP